MRLYRQFRHLRRSVRPNLNKSLNAESHLVINRDKTKKNYIYFDNIYRKSTNTFVTRHSTSEKNKTTDNVYALNKVNNKKINFSTRENSDTYVINNPLSNDNSTSKASNSNTALLPRHLDSTTVFAYNNTSEEELKIPVGSSIPFNNLSINFGHNITQIKNDEFKINSSGIYKIEFILYTSDSSPLGSAGIIMDDNPVVIPVTLTKPGTPLISHEILNLKNDNHTVKIEVSHLDLHLNAGKNASIIIEKLNQ
ncbi:hypothetical protein CPAST_c29420 [Clostridium pasteurianum DSM 525 = ATCC 6013]|uniref:BclA C-terminal domain-containing protein n=1 Tax=Clostridium pasteurianum DSM 525 = ATCC 6013 TaxID=1262449 RepID=A0A0H3J9V5_CLOPA|nr:hypothetical protein [Clostridium pasteurianum]AJA49008.1 hypothetical protein CPAST_c29420 [Clostridium pasteurianum DSM 525 = ATCC 6013]AJA52996.1 hypothetical protein CLPA_c29420 [Clostridium pasteurianum DSM 525 = ATCC 6013]AOZ76214.1 hypothetical protein AQ983_14305 [Clostridium pasteurianum DSM 525 = ATCC 6013]AOZ80010.1 hypothetical protein AQ984_14300 [Clostridium pasteurianum]ELP60304.1 collagen-like exosporium surface protein [Clostridium pasteurianum DSM 525 = ATCC 6013]